MKKRQFWRAVAALAVLYAVRSGLKMTQEARRYNHILSLSDEGTLANKVPEILPEILKSERAMVKEWAMFFMSLPKDVARYLKIESM